MNPFAVRAMIKDPAHFVGRAAELHNLYTLLASMQSCSVVGPRRIGKSSLLHYLAQPSVYTAHLPAPESYVFAFINLQELVDLEPDDFFSLVVEQLNRANQGRLEIDLDRDGTRSGFRHFLRRMTDEGLRLVLCCDEFEMLSQDASFDVRFFTYLRGLCSNYDLALATSSRSSLYDLCHQGDLQTSQFWNIFVEQPLGLMPEQEACTLINNPFTSAGISLNEQDVAFVLNLAGRHPFFIQAACYHLFEMRSVGCQSDFAAIEQQFFGEAQHHYRYTWEQLDNTEREALTTLARIQSNAIESTLFQQLQRKVLVMGNPDSARLASASWQRFIGEQTGVTIDTIQPAFDIEQSLVSMPPHVIRTETVYADFELRVERVDSQTCRVLVLDSPAGQDSAICNLPFDLEQVGQVMINLGQQIKRGVNAQTQSGVSPVAIGEALFRSVFSNAVGQLFFESLGEARSRNQGLRIKVHVDPDESPHLAALPWEFLYNDRRRQFFSLNRLTPVVRYMDVQAPTTRPCIHSPLRILVAIASPTEMPLLDLTSERTSMLQTWGNLPGVTVDFVDPATPSALQTCLWNWQPHVFHFMGHGHFDSATGFGTLLFVDKDGLQAPINGNQLGVLLANTPSVRLAFLNACESAQLARAHDLDPFSGVAAALVMAGLPAVVAMQFPISDRAAHKFASGFYSRLAIGEPVDVAVAFAREALHLETADSQEWGTPVLFMRVADGRLFELAG